MDRVELARGIQRRLQVGGLLANAAGALVVFLYLGVIFPPPDPAGYFLTTERSALVLLAFMVVATAVGMTVGLRETRALRAWMRTSDPAGPAERAAVLRMPARIVRLTALQWGAAVLLFATLNLDRSAQRVIEVGVTTALGGLVTCTAAWLYTARELSPVVGLVLSDAPPPEAGSLGIGPRILLTWALSSGIPLVGLALIPIGEDAQGRSLVAPIVFIAVVALVAGGVLMTLAMRSVADPVRGVQRGMESVAAGATDVRLPIDDASEVGRLQAGFNAMVEGLAERERLRDLFGRQVGLDVAREALDRGTALGGREQTVGALFVDVIGSTELAARERPERVVELLNAFFAVVIEIVERHGGFVNKFQGDGALCVFGAPVACDDVADRALAAARDLRDAVAGGFPLPAAIGLSSGTAVAGHIGAESRYEYTVIGDPVNEASRLTELAKTRPERLLASAATVRAAGASESARWQPAGEAILRGRAAPTELAVPAEHPGRAFAHPALARVARTASTDVR